MKLNLFYWFIWYNIIRKHKNKQNKSNNIELEESQQDTSLEGKKENCVVCNEDYLSYSGKAGYNTYAQAYHTMH